MLLKKGILSIFVAAAILAPLSAQAATRDELLAQIQQLLQLLVVLQEQIAAQNDTVSFRVPEVCGDGIDNDKDGFVDENCDQEFYKDVSIDWARSSVPSTRYYVQFTLDFGDATPSSYSIELHCDSDIDATLKVHGDGCNEQVVTPWSHSTPQVMKQSAQLINVGDSRENVTIEFSIYDEDGNIIGEDEDTITVYPEDEFKEVCGDGIDNDKDGFVDEGCDDESDVATVTEKCGDGYDNDRDGTIDENCWHVDDVEIDISYPPAHEGGNDTLEWEIRGEVTPDALVEVLVYEQYGGFLESLGTTYAAYESMRFRMPEIVEGEGSRRIKFRLKCASPDISGKYISNCGTDSDVITVYAKG